MKKLIYGISAAVICTLLSVQLAHSINNDKFDGFLYSNVEALAQSESSHYGEVCYKTITDAVSQWVLYCGNCNELTPGKPALFSGKGICY